jgi:hypothetical protein
MIKVHDLVIFKTFIIKVNFSLFLANFQFRAEVKKVTSRAEAELKIIQLELWLEPARLGLITTT